MTPVKTRSATIAHIRNLGYRSTLHYTVAQAARYFGIMNGQFRKMIKDLTFTPSPPTPLGEERYRFYRKGDIEAMAEMYPYWAKRRYHATTDNDLHRIKLSKLVPEQMPLNLTPRFVTPSPAPTATPTNNGHTPSRLDSLLTGVTLATKKYGMTVEEAAVLAKLGLFDN